MSNQPKLDPNEIVKLLDIKEAAGALNLTADYIRKLCKQNRLGHRRVNGRFRFEPRHINEFLGSK